MTLKIDYNINGIGLINPYIFPFTEKLLLNKKLSVETRLKETNQLGSIKYIHNGAHYNRYEYTLLQISILHFIKSNSEIGLGTSFNQRSGWHVANCDSLDYTFVDILQSMVLCANLGHFKETFAANKVWYHLLKINFKNFNTIFRNSLTKTSKGIFDKFMREGDYQKLHLINSIYILNRSKETKLYCELFEGFINIKDDSDVQKKWIDLYNKVRKVSYTVLDSHFSYIPIDIDLQNILFNQNLFIDELSKQNSTLFSIIDRLNDLLEDTLYLENNALLMGSYRSEEIEKDIRNYFQHVNSSVKLKDINSLLLDSSSSPFYKSSVISTQNIPWDMNLNLSLTYSVDDIHKFPMDLFEEEKKYRRKVGKNSFVAISFNPDFSKYRTVFSIKKEINKIEKVKKTIKIISLASKEYLYLKDFSKSVVNNGDMKNVFCKKIITYIFRNIMVEDYYCEYNFSKKHSPFFIEKGSKSAAKRLKKYLVELKNHNIYSEDQLHEIETVYNRLNELKYKGLIIIYVGSLRFINAERKSVCELDGVVLMPDNKKAFLNVIEAKNYKLSSQCENKAVKQLNQKFLEIIENEIFEDVSPKVVPGCGAYVELKV